MQTYSRLFIDESGSTVVKFVFIAAFITAIVLVTVFKFKYGA